MKDILDFLDCYPSITVSKPFPPIPRPNGRWMAQVAAEVSTKNWKSWKATGETPHETLLNLIQELKSSGQITCECKCHDLHDPTFGHESKCCDQMEGVLDPD